jgi:hypothetical protein
MNNLQINILFFNDQQIGTNKQLYFPLDKIYNAAKDAYSDDEIVKGLKGLTDSGYLENREKGYRITSKGFIFIEAFIISQDIKKELNTSLEENINNKIGSQWIGIGVAFLIILIIVLLK